MAEDAGLLMVLAGDEKSGDPVNAAGGMVLRALGQGLDVLVCDLAGCGEVYQQLLGIKDLPGKLTVCPCPADPASMLEELMGESGHDMVVLQSVDRVFAEGLEMKLAQALEQRPPGLHVVLSGDMGMADKADLVTHFTRRK